MLFFVISFIIIFVYVLFLLYRLKNHTPRKVSIEKSHTAQNTSMYGRDGGGRHGALHPQTLARQSGSAPRSDSCAA